MSKENIDPFNPLVCQVCGSPGSTICPWCINGPRKMSFSRVGSAEEFPEMNVFKIVAGGKMNVFMVAEPRINWAEYNRFYTSEKLGTLSIPWSDPPSVAASLVEMCGRLCYMSFGKGRKTTAEYLDNIISSEHFSVLEHANWTFIITGVSRSLTHELVRHRHFSYSQLSQRYVDHADVPAVMPPGLEGTPLGDEWLLHQARGRTLYAKMVEQMSPEGKTATDQRKAVRGIARSVLSEATETKIAVTGNARAWREFIQKRNSPHADQEIRALAGMLLERLWMSAPELFRDLKETA